MQNINILRKSLRLLEVVPHPQGSSPFPESTVSWLERLETMRDGGHFPVVLLRVMGPCGGVTNHALVVVRDGGLVNI